MTISSRNVHVVVQHHYETYVRSARAAVPHRFEVHHGRLAVVMRMLMIVTMGIAMVVAVAVRVIVAVVFCQYRQCVSF